MNPNAPFTRREFLHTGLVALSATLSVPTFVHQSASALAAENDGSSVQSKSGVPDDRILVIVQLSGGNDGLNTVIPYSADEYYQARPYLGIRENNLIKIGKSGLGLHNDMADFASLMDAGLASIILGVGYPNPNRSHFSSMDIWHTADVQGGRGLGWVGKTMDELRTVQGGNIDASACVCIGREAPLASIGRSVKGVSFENATLFRWAGADLHPALQTQYESMSRWHGATLPEDVKANPASGQVEPRPMVASSPRVKTVNTALPTDQLPFVRRTALDAQISSQKIRDAVAQQPQTRFPGGNLSDQLRMVASMIRAEMKTRVYYVSLGGFDTHANQLDQHARNLRQLSASLKAFYDELKVIGQRSRVLTMVFSEFGRRVEQNASNGTDHGTAEPVFLVGEMVRPGLIGKHPPLDTLDQGDLIFNTDFRSVYATLINDWMKLDSRKVLAGQYRNLPLLDAKRV